MKKKRLGKLPPRYSFISNPYADARFTKCPECSKATRLRKFPLLIHLHETIPIILGKTCRFCVACELIIVHQDELEALLANMFAAVGPIGHDYLVLGTVERTFWRSGPRKAKSLDEMLQHRADFKQYLHVEYRPAGWYPADEG
jgi:hypothetical protein